MGAFKKYDGSVWQSINPKQLKGIPYTGTLPAVLTGTKAGYLHRYKVYGNLTQNGTPTPENPIYPSECGERTENIWTLTATDFSESTVVVGAAKEVTITGLTPNMQYTLTSNIRKTDSDASCLWFNGTSPTNGVWNGQPRTATSSANGELKVYYRSAILPEFNDYWYMLNSGSTALPYEPYGYKLPLTSGSTPVDIYLGESQTTRRIKKLVLDGTETPASITQTTDGNNYCVAYKYSDLGMTDIKDYDKLTYLCSYPVFISSHFTMKSIEGLPLPNDYNDIQPGQVGGNTWIAMVAGTPTYNRNIIFCVSGITTINDFKAYLAQQYANGTPVTVWYVLATEETGIVNEPLRKIGDYADTIDSTQTTAQIPTSANSTTITWAGQGLAPSQFDSIQEWVDIPTYKRVNGEWVADN